MRRILLTGKNGQVGWELQRTLATFGDVVPCDRTTMDLANPDAIRRTIRDIKPDVIVNAAAYTAVDRAESEPELAMAINGVAPGILAEEAKRLGALLVHYSTDYVFDGTKEGPYTEEDEPSPLNVYGKTKLAGERAIQQVGGRYLILRTSWVYGPRGNNFLLTILRLAKERKELRIVNDQIGAPTWSRMIAEATSVVIGKLVRDEQCAVSVSAIFHLTARGETSWYGFAQRIIEKVRNQNKETPSKDMPTIIPVSSDEYPLPAQRPANSRLSSVNLVERFGINLPSWERCLDLCLEESSEGSLFRLRERMDPVVSL